MAAALAFSLPVSSPAAQHTQALSYADSLDDINNPDIGFYRPIGISLKESGNKAVDYNVNLVHLRFDIAAFSSNALVDKDNNIYGKSAPISDDALKAAGETLDNVKKRGHKAIVRFCYDKGYNGRADCEPDMEMLLTHIKQIGELYTDHVDAIAYIELGMFGPWGEMHTSKCCENENMINAAAALDAMLKATPDSLCIGVRRPIFIALWMGIDGSEFDIDNEKFKAAAAEKGSLMYRVGIFNDGYLGSSTDLGTYDHGITRDMCVRFLEKYGKNTPYGGEAIGGTSVSEWNSVDFVSTEAFLTHTSYLNWEWNYNLTQTAWANEIYSGNDEYNGKTAQKYIRDHLGYRFVVRDSSLPYAAEKGKKVLSRVRLENVGFGNISTEQRLTYILRDANGNVFELSPEAPSDPKGFFSGETDVSARLELPQDIAAGRCAVYMRISKYGQHDTDNNFGCIRFANAAEQWDAETGANYIGSFKVTEKGAPEMLFKKLADIINAEELEKYGDDFDFNGDGNVDILDIISVL